MGCFVSDGEKRCYCYPESINAFRKEPDTKQGLRKKTTIHHAAVINSCTLNTGERFKSNSSEFNKKWIEKMILNLFYFDLWCINWNSRDLVVVLDGWPT